MNLAEYVRVVKKRWRIVGLLVLLGLLVGTALTVLTVRKYEATVQIFVSSSGSDSSLQQLAQGNTFVQARVQSYTSVANSPRVTEPVIKSLGLDITPSQLASEITADAPLNKVLINISVTDNSSSRASVLANAVAQQFSTVVEAIDQTSADSASSPVKLTVIQPAAANGALVSPNTPLNLAVGLVLGLLLGLGLAAVRQLLDNTVKSPSDLVAISSVPVIGIVPFDKAAARGAVSFREDSHGLRAEAFRQLRTNLQFIDVDSPPRAIAVTSALPGEGKTHTALNLAAALAEAGLRVCLIEADLRRPTLAATLGLVADVGFTTVLIGKSTIEEVLQNAGTNLAVMTSGPVPPNPSELLLSEQARKVIDHIADRVDLVIVDTAPLLPVSDGALVAALADATILTVRAQRTTREQMRRAVDQLRGVGVVPVGTVLSMAPSGRKSDYSYYYGDYRPSASSKQSDPLVGPTRADSEEELR